MLWGIFGSKTHEVTREWRKLHNEELNDLYSLPNIDREIKWRRMRIAEHLRIWGGREAYTGFGRGNLRERDHLRDPGVDGSIILRWIFRKWDVGSMDWIELAQDRDRWRVLVNAVMKIRVP